MTVNRDQITAFRTELLAWYHRSARDLPWRRTDEPYAIWISEVMLQQTRVDQAAPFYERFLQQFPDISRLAAASIDDVLKAWEGLGYYRRARNLHRAAGEIMDRFDGVFPSDMEAMRSLPGIGEYTSAAIASIAFGHRSAAVDGNVKRVLARAFAIEKDIKSSQAAREVRQLSDELIAPTAPGDYNEAVMELGATICTPKNPSCDSCPLQMICSARELDLVDALPVSSRKGPIPHHRIGVGLVTDDVGRILLVRRSEDQMLGGLWEFPNTRVSTGESDSAAGTRSVLEQTGIEVEAGPKVIEFDHAYTHFRISVAVFACQTTEQAAPSGRWFTPAELPNLAMHRSSRRIADLFLEHNALPVVD